ncbi:helix-turn-helix domain-containing protein [Candidatus Protofrankia californiensis]|uniref:helix-turn-helix domain-containing protein n=1 Tax=Candidatus Protofrankia californiensis TaxID=1839754 RepID=UPI001041324A|nr:helix-turn-helix domain-containing protein [Candidatus Protofrankia californiensis]
MSKLLLSTSEAAERLSIGRSKLYDLIRANKIDTVKIGSRRLVPVSALAVAVESLVRDGVL